ncbi:hypothetical protein ES703_21749 [subsurface metagenome]
MPNPFRKRCTDIELFIAPRLRWVTEINRSHLKAIIAGFICFPAKCACHAVRVIIALYVTGAMVTSYSYIDNFRLGGQWPWFRCSWRTGSRHEQAHYQYQSCYYQRFFHCTLLYIIAYNQIDFNLLSSCIYKEVEGSNPRPLFVFLIPSIPTKSIVYIARQVTVLEMPAIGWILLVTKSPISFMVSPCMTAIIS